MATIQPVISTTNFSLNQISQAISNLGNRTVSLINAAKMNTTNALLAVKNTAVNVSSAAWVALKALITNTVYYISAGFAKAISAVEVTVTSFAKIFGPYYPIVAIAIVSLALGVILSNYVEQSQSQN